MKTIINIDGGLGRVITAIPALLKYGKLHPDEDWYVMIPGWDFMTWGIEELQQRTFNPETKGMFENYYWDADKVISPEPYKLPAFYRNEISLREAFDVLINETTDHSDLPEMSLTITIDEILNAKQIIGNVRNFMKAEKKKMVVIQPFGSTAYNTELGVYDKSMRSFNHVFANKLVEKLSKDYLVINMNAPLLMTCGTGCGSFPEWDKIASLQPDPDLRTWAAIIQEADYFVGCDSCGQHIARAVGTDASVVVAGTHEINVSYPEKFHIIKRKDAKYYPNPMRVSMMNSTLADKLNQNRAAFTEKEMDEAIKDIIKRIEKNTGSTNKKLEENVSKGFTK
jgi:hypothetical protein